MTPVLSNPVDSVQDMLMSDSQLIVPSPTMIDTLLKLDPRSSVQQLNENHIKMPIQTVFSSTTKDRYILIVQIDKLKFFRVICFSIEAGKLTLIMTESGYRGKYHYGRETIFSSHTSSAVVPKGSPLKVSFHVGPKKASCNRNWKFQFITLSLFQNVFDENISWLRDTGIINKMVEDEKRTDNVRSTAIVSENQPLTIMRYLFK